MAHFAAAGHHERNRRRRSINEQSLIPEKSQRVKPGSIQTPESPRGKTAMALQSNNHNFCALRRTLGTNYTNTLARNLFSTVHVVAHKKPHV